MEGKPRSLLEALKAVPDPRGRRGQRYPLASLLGLLLLAALAGQTTLKGMVEWIHQRIEGWMARYLEERDLWRVPQYNTFYRVVRQVDAGALARVLQEGFQEVSGEAGPQRDIWAVDGKTLRGSHRKKGQPGWKVLHVFHQAAGYLKDWIWVPEGKGEETALIRWLVEQPSLEGKILTLDGGLMDRTVATAVVAKKGGMLAGSKPEASPARMKP